jgi:hypothetical protein
MISRREQINEAIVSQKANPYTGNVDNTYLNDNVFREFVKHRDLKLVYVTKLGLKYRWTKEEIQLMYDKTPDSWETASGKVINFDFGLGENKVAVDGRDEKYHQPHHDHIHPRSLGKQDGWEEARINHPNNIQITSNIQNVMKRDFTLDEWLDVAPTIPDLMVDKT